MELEHSIGFGGAVKCSLWLHPGGEHVVYAQGGNVLVASLLDAHDQAFLRGHDDQVTCLAMSSSGRFIVSGQRGDNADVIVWDFESRRIMYRLQEHDVGVQIVTLSADERFLLSVGMDKKMVVYDMHTGCIVAKHSGLKHTTCACWGGRKRDNKRRQTTAYQLAMGGDAQLTFWELDPMEGRLTAAECTLGNQVRNFSALAFSADEEYLFAGSTSSDFSAVHVKHRVLHSTTACGSGGVATMLAMPTPSGDRIIVGCGDGAISVFEGLRNGAGTCRTFLRGPPEACSVSLDGVVTGLQLQHQEPGPTGELKLLAGTLEGTLYAASLMCADQRAIGAPPAATRVLHESHNGPVVACAYPRTSSDFFATASADGTLRVWDVNTYGVVSKAVCQPQITGSPLCLAFTGEVLFSGWEDGKIRSHDAESGEELWLVDHAHKDGVTAIESSYNRKFMISGGYQGEVRVWDVRTREMVVHLKQHMTAITSLCLFEDDSHAISASRDGNIYVWNLASESRAASLTQRMGGINAFVMLPDHVQLISVGQEKGFSFWDSREPQPIVQTPLNAEMYTIDVHTPSEGPFAGDAVFATAGADGIIKLWSHSTRRLIADGHAHSAPIRSLKFSTDGRQLVSVGDDAAVLVWNVFLDEDPAIAPAPAP